MSSRTGSLPLPNNSTTGSVLFFFQLIGVLFIHFLLHLIFLNTEMSLQVWKGSGKVSSIKSFPELNHEASPLTVTMC